MINKIPRPNFEGTSNYLIMLICDHIDEQIEVLNDDHFILKYSPIRKEEYREIFKCIVRRIDECLDNGDFDSIHKEIEKFSETFKHSSFKSVKLLPVFYEVDEAFRIRICRKFQEELEFVLAKISSTERFETYPDFPYKHKFYLIGQLEKFKEKILEVKLYGKESDREIRRIIEVMDSDIFTEEIKKIIF